MNACFCFFWFLEMLIMFEMFSCFRVQEENTASMCSRWVYHTALKVWERSGWKVGFSSFVTVFRSGHHKALEDRRSPSTEALLTNSCLRPCFQRWSTTSAPSSLQSRHSHPRMPQWWRPSWSSTRPSWALRRSGRTSGRVRDSCLTSHHRQSIVWLIHEKSQRNFLLKQRFSTGGSRPISGSRGCFDWVETRGTVSVDNAYLHPVLIE